MGKKLNFVVFEDVGGRFGSEFVSINRQEADKWPRHGRPAARTDRIAQPTLPNSNSQGAASTGPAEPQQFQIDDSLTPA